MTTLHLKLEGKNYIEIWHSLEAKFRPGRLLKPGQNFFWGGGSKLRPGQANWARPDFILCRSKNRATNFNRQSLLTDKKLLKRNKRYHFDIIISLCTALREYFYAFLLRQKYNTKCYYYIIKDNKSQTRR
mgnify:CR=1 FL=1